MKKVRDISLHRLNDEETLVVVCDSCGGIGEKENDVLQVPPFYTGKFTARVPLIELLCTGARVVSITNNVCCEMERTGRQIIRGVLSEMKELEIEEDLLTGSTEENFTTSMTAVGITVIGVAKNKDIKINNIKSNSIIALAGIPKVGAEIDFSKDDDIVSYTQIKELLAIGGVYELVPVGSKGILYEIEELSSNNNMKFNLDDNNIIDLYKSAGPATCVVFAAEEEIYMKRLKNKYVKLGNIYKK
ncbi:AIR synthase related protein [Clostridium sp. DL1XJH146]